MAPVDFDRIDFLPSRGYIPPTFASDHTETSFRVKATLMRTYDDLRQVEHELKEKNALLSLELEKLNTLLDTLLDEEGLTRRQLFVLKHMQRMEGEKGWTLAFLSPSVVDFLEEEALADFLEDEVRFFYDAHSSSESS